MSVICARCGERLPPVKDKNYQYKHGKEWFWAFAYDPCPCVTKERKKQSEHTRFQHTYWN